MNKNASVALQLASGARRRAARQRTMLAALTSSLAAVSSAQAAGGHHAVDDAALLEPGQCQVETWFDHELGGERRLLHVGPGCRVGAVEFGLNFDRARLGGSQTETIAGAQIKWAREIGNGWSAGVVFGVAGQDRSPRYLGSTLVVPVTWQVSETLFTHFNVGRDFRHGQADTSRAGLAVEWAALKTWSFVAEHFREGAANFGRGGARWQATPSINVDLGYARGLNSSTPAWWTLGLTWVFDR